LEYPSVVELGLIAYDDEENGRAMRTMIGEENRRVVEENDEENGRGS